MTLRSTHLGHKLVAVRIVFIPLIVTVHTIKICVNRFFKISKHRFDVRIFVGQKTIFMTGDTGIVALGYGAYRPDPHHHNDEWIVVSFFHANQGFGITTRQFCRECDSHWFLPDPLDNQELPNPLVKVHRFSDDNQCSQVLFLLGPPCDR